jgi:hypothetical protein
MANNNNDHDLEIDDDEEFDQDQIARGPVDQVQAPNAAQPDPNEDEFDDDNAMPSLPVHASNSGTECLIPESDGGGSTIPLNQ